MHLKWEAPAACPQRGDVLERIRKLAGTTLDKSSGLSVEGRIQRSGAQFLLTVLVREGSEVRERVIASSSCEDLGGAAAITLAFLLGIEVDTSSVDGEGAGQSTDSTAATVGSNGTANSGAGIPDETQDQGVGALDDEQTSGGRWGVLTRLPTLVAEEKEDAGYGPPCCWDGQTSTPVG